MAETMNAIRFDEFGEPEVLKYVEVEKPQPGPGQILVKVEAVGINYADAMRRRNNYLEPTQIPAVLGGEIAGTVEGLGEGVTNFTVGARIVAVVNNGAYAQYAVLPARFAFPLPATLSFAEAASLIVQGVTAYEIIKVSGQMKEGESIVVHAAAGGVGVFAVQIAKLLGAGKVIATASTPAKLELARSLGADVLVNYTEADWYKQVREATDGQGADVILEMAGGEIFNQNFKCLAVNGRVVIYGVASRQLPTLTASQLMNRNHTITGYWLVNTIARPKQFGEALQALLGWIGQGQLKVIVGETIPLAEASKAHTMLEGRQTTGKIVLLPHA